MSVDHEVRLIGGIFPIITRSTHRQSGTNRYRGNCIYRPNPVTNQVKISASDAVLAYLSCVATLQEEGTTWLAPWSAQQRIDRLADIFSFHQVLADKDGIHSGIFQPLYVLAAMNTALSDQQT